MRHLFIIICLTLIKFTAAQGDLLSLSAHYHQTYPAFHYSSEKYVFDSLGISKEAWMDYFSWEGDDVFQGLDSISGEDLFDFSSYNMGLYFALAVNTGKLNRENLIQFANEAGYWMIWSEDSSIMSMQFEEQHGGTYHSNIAHLVQFEGNHVANLYMDPEWEQEFHENQHAHGFSTDGYSQIIQLNDKQYLATGSVRGCSTCFGHYAELWTKKDELEITWSRHIFGRDYNATFSYNEESKVLSVSYITDDLLPQCYCEGDAPETDYDFNWEELKQCTCSYLYKEGCFVLIEAKEEMYKEE